LPSQPIPIPESSSEESAQLPGGKPVSQFRTPKPAPEEPTATDSPSDDTVHSKSACEFPTEEPTKEEPACPPDRAWHGEDAEYLLWWLKSARLPPLVTASRAGFAPTLGQPNTRLLLGDSLLDQEEHSGGRFTLATPLFEANEETRIGLEGTYFFLGTRTDTFVAGGSGSTVLGRPFIDAITAQEQAHIIAGPGLPPGGITAAYSSRLQGAEMNGIGTVRSDCNFQFDTLIGFRYLEVDEGLAILEQMGTAGVADQFDGHNRFYGGQLGARLDFRSGGLFANFLGKVALGETFEVIRINGLTATPAGTQTGGFLALPTNSGRAVHEAFAVVPELDVKVGYHVSDQVRFFVGYSFLYLSDLVRPADQIDRTLNAGQVPMLSPGGGALAGAARPALPNQRSDFWAQGLGIGMEFRY
jgi:hypothetical protein